MNSKDIFNAIETGENLFIQGKIEEAEKVFLSAIEGCPGNPQAWNNLGVAALNLNKIAEAEKYLNKAIEIKPDFLEAWHNLSEFYINRKNWPKAVRSLKNLLSIYPGDYIATKSLTKVYLEMGHIDKAKEILDNSKSSQAMKSFIDSLWLAIKFHPLSEKNNQDPRQLMENFALSILKFLDGLDGRGIKYKLVAKDPENNEEIILEDFCEFFYYQEKPFSSQEEKLNGLVLTVDDEKNWAIFQNALKKEMLSEGGCLGDYTQTKKVFRANSFFHNYDLESTLKYFHHNLGPCDCHVVRGNLI